MTKNIKVIFILKLIFCLFLAIVFYNQKMPMIFENHVHLSLHKFNSHHDTHEKSSTDHLHKHKHEDNGKEHEHSHPSVIEFKEFLAFTKFKVQFKKFEVRGVLTPKIPIHLSSDYSSEILRPPIGHLV